jgi:Flp pilus assembly pilin Flp
MKRNGEPMKPLSLLRQLKRDTRGANMVEYIILVGVVALLAIVAFRFFNTSIREKVNNQAKVVNGINASEGP